MKYYALRCRAMQIGGKIRKPSGGAPQVLSGKRSVKIWRKSRPEQGWVEEPDPSDRYVLAAGPELESLVQSGEYQGGIPESAMPERMWAYARRLYAARPRGADQRAALALVEVPAPAGPEED